MAIHLDRPDFPVEQRHRIAAARLRKRCGSSEDYVQKILNGKQDDSNTITDFMIFERDLLAKTP